MKSQMSKQTVYNIYNTIYLVKREMSLNEGGR